VTSTTRQPPFSQGGPVTGSRRRSRDSELRPRPVRLPDHGIRTEYDMVRLLEAGVYHLDDIVAASVELGLPDRDDGWRLRRHQDPVYRHRVRAALDSRRRHGRDARSIGDAYWIIDGTPRRPGNAVFVFLGQVSDITLALGAAAEVASRIDEPADLIFCDPPWQLGIGQGRDARPDADYYRRSRDLLVPGYIDVDPDADYYEWSQQWIEPAAKVLRPGGHLAVVTGPGQAAAVQMAAQGAGLTFLNSVVVPRINGVAPTRNKFASSHFRLTVMAQAPTRANRTFNALPELGVDQRGQPSPRDVWPPVLPHDGRRRLRYPNQLPATFADQVIRTFTNTGDYVADFFAGSGTVPRICLFRERRCFASDENPNSLRFTMATISDIVQSRLAAPSLFDTSTCLFPELREETR